jgi:hypothetical protein
MVARLDRHTKRMMRAAPGLTFSRTDAVRALLAQALDLVEAEEKGGES